MIYTFTCPNGHKWLGVDWGDCFCPECEEMHEHYERGNKISDLNIEQKVEKLRNEYITPKKRESEGSCIECRKNTAEIPRKQVQNENS